MGQLKQWRDQQWVRIGTDGKIKGPCGTSKDKKNPDRCLPKAKAQSLSKEERAKTARKKKKAGARGKTVVSNTPKAKVRTSPASAKVKKPTSPASARGRGIIRRSEGGPVRENHKGCGAVMGGRRKKTLYVRGTKNG